MQKSKLNIREIMLWSLLLLATAAAFWGTYSFQFSAPIKALIWVGWLVVSFALGLLTSPGQRAFSFGKDAKLEMQKVVWPTRQETVQTTSIVMVMVAVAGFVLWMVDSVMIWAIGKITHLG